MIKRPIVVAVIGYLIGIIMGLYFNISIVFFYIIISAIYFIIRINKYFSSENRNEKFKLFSLKRYFRYTKLFINKSVLICLVSFSIISNTIIIFQNQKYENLYKNEEKIIGEGVIISNKEEKEYYDMYKIKILKVKGDIKDNKKYKNTYLYIRINKKLIHNLEYGDKVFIKGEYIEPDKATNYGGFNYKEYLKTLKIYGTIQVEELSILKKQDINFILYYSNEISIKIKEKIDLILSEQYSSLLKGIILGDNSDIKAEIEEKFKISNISHVLAISGMHISYLIIGINIIFKHIMEKRKVNIISIILLIIYIFITGFSPSVVRASVMGILVIISKIIYRKNDIWNSIAISLFVILIYNPFLINNVGLQFSYVGTIGIILFNKNMLKMLEKIKIRNKRYKYKINKKKNLFISKIREILSVTISAQLAIMPVMLYHFNMFGTYFFITNLLVSFIIGPIIILGIIIVVLPIFLFPFSGVISKVLEILLQSLIFISNISKLPISRIYISTPKIWQIILYYLISIIYNNIFCVYNYKKINYTQKRVKNLIAVIKYKIAKNKIKFYKILVIIILGYSIIQLIPNKLKINFVDVGQGDCCFIETPNNKTILIDGGGSLSDSFDVGKSIVLPYILDKGYTKVDYIFISHFDQDHVGGILTILNELKVGIVFISRQEENTDNYQKFLKNIKDKKIKVNVVEAGDVINVEKDLYIKVLWPGKEQIQENILNNNSMVFKLNYNKFSMLFTGDIEEIAEKQILEKYKYSNNLSSTILKVAHHGAKTSTTKEFLDNANPKISLIGVGKNNKFGHPSDIILNRLKERGIIIYRTDEKGEINININKRGKVLIKQ